MPEITLNLPVALGLMVLILAIGAGVVFAVLRSTGRVTEPTPTVTPTLTSTITLSPTASLTPTLEPSFTPLPPIEYTIRENDSCLAIAAFFGVDVRSIVILNNLPADCGVLSIGQKILVPQPTPTASPYPTATLSGAEATDAACPKDNYLVKSGDTLSGIARSYNVSMDSIKEYNGLTSDVVFEGMTLIIPLCERNPTAGPTPTETPPPPYLAPNLLLPADGTSFQMVNETITLQWASVGSLRANEAYQVTVEDVTEGTGRKLVEYVTDTKFIVPVAFRPTDTTPHIIRWTVVAVRQIGSDNDGKPIWTQAGAESTPRVFSWSGTQVITPTP